MTDTSKPIRLGYAKGDITPPLPFPMAGYLHKQERLAERVRDPLCARVAVFDDGQRVLALILVDLLAITHVLREAVAERIRAKGVSLDGFLLTATHTHSAAGGYWEPKNTWGFMGRFRPELFEHLVEGIATTVAAAAAEPRPATLTFGAVPTEGLNFNRRHADGPVDRAFTAMTFTWDDGRRLRIFSFGGHPVIVSERDHHAASACWPGTLARTFEEEGDEAMVLVGPVGGVNVLHPEGPMEVEVHLRLVTRLLREQADAALAQAEPVEDLTLGFGVGEAAVDVVRPRLFPRRLGWADALIYPFRMWLQRFGRKALPKGHRTQVPVLKVGDVVFTGFPADVGAGVGLAARRIIDEQGLRTGAVASQTSDYVGYVHMPEDYELLNWDDKFLRGMTIYENGLGFGGRDMGTKLVAAFEAALAGARSQG